MEIQLGSPKLRRKGEESI
uniref:Uncharacterized protein n=1 Tax=Anguilla anguilla TaxID=7936 RepID=A0A0E9VMS9_ANGAN